MQLHCIKCGHVIVEDENLEFYIESEKFKCTTCNVSFYVDAYFDEVKA